jgi:hypothetical protein
MNDSNSGYVGCLLIISCIFGYYLIGWLVILMLHHQILFSGLGLILIVVAINIRRRAYLMDLKAKNLDEISSYINNNWKN